MHIRVNLPPWGWREPLSGVRAMIRADYGRDCLRRLRALCQEQVGPDWDVELFASGREALTAAVTQRGWSGRQVAVPGYVCPAVIRAVQAAGATPVPVDCLPDGFQWDPPLLRRARDERQLAGAIAANSLGIDQDFAMLAQLGLPIIDDAAYQAHTCDESGRRRGTRGVAGVWSWNFKTMTGVGGGAWLRRRSDVENPNDVEPRAVRMRRSEIVRLGSYTLRGWLRHRIPRVFPGARPPGTALPLPFPTNVYANGATLPVRARGMSGLQAAVLATQAEHYAENDRIRDLHRAAYREVLGNAGDGYGSWRVMEPGATPHLLPVLALTCDESASALQRAQRRALVLRRALYQNGVQTEEPYPIPSDDGVALPRTRSLSSRLVLIPCHAGISERLRGRLKGILAGALREANA